MRVNWIILFFELMRVVENQAAPYKIGIVSACENLQCTFVLDPSANELNRLIDLVDETRSANITRSRNENDEVRVTVSPDDYHIFMKKSRSMKVYRSHTWECYILDTNLTIPSRIFEPKKIIKSEISSSTARTIYNASKTSTLRKLDDSGCKCLKTSSKKFTGKTTLKPIKAVGKSSRKSGKRVERTTKRITIDSTTPRNFLVNSITTEKIIREIGNVTREKIQSSVPNLPILGNNNPTSEKQMPDNYTAKETGSYSSTTVKSLINSTSTIESTLQASWENRSKVESVTRPIIPEYSTEESTGSRLMKIFEELRILNSSTKNDRKEKRDSRSKLVHDCRSKKPRRMKRANWHYVRKDFGPYKASGCHVIRIINNCGNNEEGNNDVNLTITIPDFSPNEHNGPSSSISKPEGSPLVQPDDNIEESSAEKPDDLQDNQMPKQLEDNLDRLIDDLSPNEDPDNESGGVVDSKSHVQFENPTDSANFVNTEEFPDVEDERVDPGFPKSGQTINPHEEKPFVSPIQTKANDTNRTEKEEVHREKDNQDFSAPTLQTPIISDSEMIKFPFNPNLSSFPLKPTFTGPVQVFDDTYEFEDYNEDEYDGEDEEGEDWDDSDENTDFADE